jgi:hypothetical protein
MSRGPGKWQHGILVALKAHPTMYLNDLLPKDGARAGYNSLRRAAYALASRGAIFIRHRARADGAHVVLARPGHNGSAGAAKEGKAMKVTAFKRRRRVVQEDGPNPIDVFVGKRMRAPSTRGSLADRSSGPSRR